MCILSVNNSDLERLSSIVVELYQEQVSVSGVGAVGGSGVGVIVRSQYQGHYQVRGSESGSGSVYRVNVWGWSQCIMKSRV